MKREEGQVGRGTRLSPDHDLTRIAVTEEDIDKLGAGDLRTGKEALVRDDGVNEHAQGVLCQLGAKLGGSVVHGDHRPG